MKVLIAGQTFGPRNGPGVFTRNLASGLAAAGHEVTVAVPAQPVDAAATVRIAHVRSIPLAPLYPGVYVSIASGKAARKLLQDLQPDIVHLQDHYPLCRAMLRAATVPVVVSNHFVPENIGEQTWLGRFRAFNRFSWRLALDVLNAADAVTAPTKTAAEMLVRNGVTSPVRAISCGVDTKRFAPDPSVVRSDNTGIYVGRLDRDKDVMTLVEAIALTPSVRLVIAGRGRDQRRLRKAASVWIRFAGFVGDDDLPRLLRSASFFAIAGRAELQSIAALEAMACGLPVVAADALALPELVTSGVNGQLFRPGDARDAARAIHSVLAGDWHAMSRASRERAEGHDISATVAAYEQLYAGLI